MNVLCYGDSLTAGYTSNGGYYPYADYLKCMLELHSISTKSRSGGGGSTNSNATNAEELIGAQEVNDGADEVNGKDKEMSGGTAEVNVGPKVDTGGSLNEDYLQNFYKTFTADKDDARNIPQRPSITVDHIGMSGWTTLEMALGLEDEENYDW